MKRLILSLISLGITFTSFSQSISPQILGSAGTHFTGSNAQLSWTIGEPVINTLDNGSNIITQGFHQTLLIITAIEEQSIEGVNVKVYPNPTSNLVIINLVNNLKDLKLELFDMTGKLLHWNLFGFSEGNVQFSLKDYASANYLLRIYAVDGSVNFTYMIEKLTAN
ncbi:MAG: T9SS type A sorting domain-containing protein [Saprospiraceae bacterium]|uniref:T9SS type A sorting domain-containing protein n=1 Tax=Candidatus Opimibacter skivensis TaxID=2982028 RepID=A0A9D7ST87_9BACT|nr:T9SS type A sorting domain-containing protein [Candidatus Opimibacter skivensis]